MKIGFRRLVPLAICLAPSQNDDLPRPLTRWAKAVVDPAPIIYRFGAFELDVDQYELRREGVALRVEPRVLDLLIFLIRNRDRAVSKAELLESVWNARFISDSALTRCVLQARKAIAAEGGTDEAIRTIHRRGYRFVAPVTEQRADERTVVPVARGTIIGTADSEAEKLYLRGRVHWNKRHPDAIRQAIASFQEAVERDPLYSQAFAGLADAYLMLGFLQVLSPLDVIPKAKAAAFRAIELDPALAEPHASLGYMTGFFDWEWDTAQRELQKAMSLNPHYAWAPHWYGILAAPRSLEESLDYLNRARELDPLSPIIHTAVGIPLHQHRRYQEAVRLYTQVLESEASFAPAYYYLGMSYEQLGDYEQAISNLNRAAEIGGRTAPFLGALGHCYGLSGNRDEAVKLLQELEARAALRYVSPYNVMLIHLGMGETELAFDWLARALEERAGWLWMTPVEPRFDRLRAEPRFQALVGRYGLATA
jgi:DNA-binding winged helix-turn-helix (wHTH) protein/tetratricopeptide (TPR) repeat protein